MSNATQTIKGVVLSRIEDDGGKEFKYRVAKDGRRVRCTSLNGSVHVVAGWDRAWFRLDGKPEVSTTSLRGGRSFIPVPDDYEFGLKHFSWQRWEGNDFTAPTGPAVDTHFLGRPAWKVSLAPPPHKPFPLEMVIDQASGLVLAEGDPQGIWFSRWIELEVDPHIDEALFAWRDTDRLAARYE